MKRAILHHEAEEELLDAVDYYEVREPGAGSFVAKRDGDQLVCGRQRQVCRKEAEAAGDEILVGAHGGGVRGIVPVRQGDQRRRVHERDFPRDFTVRGVCGKGWLGRHLRLPPARERR